jgi:hypothetical protein
MGFINLLKLFKIGEIKFLKLKIKFFFHYLDEHESSSLNEMRPSSLICLQKGSRLIVKDGESYYDLKNVNVC